MRADLASLKCVCDEIARTIKSAESSKIAESSAIFLLCGDIGAGKTTLVKAFARYVGIKESVTSPTFSLLHIYNAESRLDSANSQNLVKNNPSLRDSAKQNRGNPPIKKNIDLQSGLPREQSSLAMTNFNGLPREQSSLAMTNFNGLPRSHSLARNDENLVYSLCLRSDQNDKLKKIAESAPIIYHYDLYQKGVDSAIDLGLLDLLGECGIHFVEWGDERLFNIIKDAFENIFIIQITKAKNDRIYEFKSEF